MCASQAQQTVGDLMDQGRSPRTVNSYLASIKAFTSWLVRDRRMPDNPLAGLRKYNEQIERHVQRRALLADEAQRLIFKTAVSTVPLSAMNGHHRALLYHLAIGTGLRLSAIRSLSWANFELDDLEPTVTVRASYSKHRREDMLPVPHDLAQALREWKVKQPDVARVVPLTQRGAEIPRADLSAVGIPYEDDAGRAVDFHALRVTFISLLGEAGVYPMVIQTLARHSTIDLTMGVYMKFQGTNQREALDALPSLAVTSISKETMRMRANT